MLRAQTTARIRGCPPAAGYRRPGCTRWRGARQRWRCRACRRSDWPRNPGCLRASRPAGKRTRHARIARTTTWRAGRWPRQLTRLRGNRGLGHPTRLRPPRGLPGTAPRLIRQRTPGRRALRIGPRHGSRRIACLRRVVVRMRLIRGRLLRGCSGVIGGFGRVLLDGLGLGRSGRGVFLGGQFGSAQDLTSSNPSLENGTPMISGFGR